MAPLDEDKLPGTPDEEQAVVHVNGSSSTIDKMSVERNDDPSDDKVAKAEQEAFVDVTYWDITREFFMMGWIAFGGPAAHIGLFQKRFVEKLRWMSAEVFMELFSLGQCLPGPTSTQVSFAIGTIKKGVSGGLLSGALFQYPGAIIMTALGAGAATWLVNPPGWLAGAVAGVSAVGVALVASAAKGMMMKMCDNRVTATICTLVAGVTVYWTLAWLYPTVIAVGGIITIVVNWKKDMAVKGSDNSVRYLGVNLWVGICLILAWLGVLVAVLVVVRDGKYTYANPQPLQWFEVFYRIGSIIYGGGQVVLPLLATDLVRSDCSTTPCTETGWVTSSQFYAGLGVVQAMPGPLFNFSAYLGAIIARNNDYTFILGAVLAWFGIFGPGVTLMFGVLPLWAWFRQFQIYRRALPGMNAAGIGLILASVFQMGLQVYNISPFHTYSLWIAFLAFTAVDQLKLFEPGVVLAGGVLGIIGWAGNAY